MKHSLRKIFLSNAQIKIISLILGYSFWYIFSQSHACNIWVDAPISFYNIPKNLQIEAPEKIKMQLSAKRADLYTIDKKTVAFHIDMQNAKRGDTIIQPLEEQLLLPQSIKMVRCYPANIAISITESNV